MLFRSIGRADLKTDPRFVSRATRVANMAAVDELLETWSKTQMKHDVAKRMIDAGVPCAAIRTLKEVMNDENMHARGSLQWIDHPVMGRIVLPNSPLIFEGTPRLSIEPNVKLGDSNNAVLGEWLGRSKEELAKLKSAGVF